jgi:hypothetical protein
MKASRAMKQMYHQWARFPIFIVELYLWAKLFKLVQRCDQQYHRDAHTFDRTTTSRLFDKNYVARISCTRARVNDNELRTFDYLVIMTANQWLMEKTN